MSDELTQARNNVASRYPVLVGTCPASGVPIEGICHRAIKGGYWDKGALVKDEVKRLLRDRQEDCPE